MNKFFKNFILFISVIFISFVFGFIGSVFLLTVKKVNLPIIDIDLEKILPQKSVIIEKTEQVYVGNDDRLKEVYKNVLDSVVYIAQKNTDGVYYQKDIIKDGFVFTSDGWIFTNDQSIFDKNKEYVVVLSDGKYYNVENILFDKYDFVLLKINNQKMLVSSFGSYDAINVGSLVFSGSSYSGIDIDYIKNKSNGVLKTINNNIKNVCLFDLSGKIIGIKGAAYQDGPKNKYGKSEVIKTDFIYSTEYLKNIIYSLNSKSGYILRPSLSGVVFSEYGDILGSDEKIEKGIYVKSVDTKNNNGFVVGDLITWIDGVSVDKNLDFILQNYKVGDRMKFVLIRNGKEISNSIVLK